jgi:Zn-dependent peptidase ImmA (M78 family)
MNRRKIKLLVDTIIRQNNLTIPIDVEKVAQAIGAELKWDDFDGSLSGFAFQKHGSKYIGVNSLEGEQRQRFTIAHELGHLFLHKQNSVSYDTGMIMLRDGHSSDGTDIKEIEANRFAAELLMPEESIREDLASKGQIDLVGDSETTKQLISNLADKYNVSPSAMSIRLTTLYFS